MGACAAPPVRLVQEVVFARCERLAFAVIRKAPADKQEGAEASYNPDVAELV